MATLNPPGGGKGVMTVDDDQVDTYLAQGWVRAKDGDGGALPEPEPTEVVTDTDTGGPEADDEARDSSVRTVVSDSLGDPEVLVTDFGREGDEPVKGGTEPLPAAGDVEAQVASDDSAETRQAKGRTARPKP